MSKPNRRKVRMEQFRQQWSEQVLPADRLREVELDDDTSVFVKIPVLLKEDDPFPQQMQEASTEEEVCLVVLSGHPERSAQEQWEMWQAAGYDAADLMALFQSLRAEADEAAQRFRYKG